MIRLLPVESVTNGYDCYNQVVIRLPGLLEALRLLSDDVQLLYHLCFIDIIVDMHFLEFKEVIE